MRKQLIILAAAMQSVLLASSALGQTAFTYQGRLGSNGVAVTGTADFRFELFDDEFAIGSIGGSGTRRCTACPAT